MSVWDNAGCTLLKPFIGLNDSFYSIAVTRFSLGRSKCHSVVT
jgi:hypothetical protein